MKIFDIRLFIILIFTSLFFIINSEYFLSTIHNTLRYQCSLDATTEINPLMREYVTKHPTSNKSLSLQENSRYQQPSSSGSSTIHHIVSITKSNSLNARRDHQISNLLSSSENLSYTLKDAATTSAGVFDGDVLVRTLWSNEKRSAGTYDLSAVWDGKDDDGNYVADKKYTIKVVSNNVTYEWLKPIGNTSTASSGSSVHHASQMITGMVQAEQDVFCAIGYNEIAQAHTKFTVGLPNAVTTTLKEGGMAVRFLAYDGNVVYCGGQRDAETSFITGLVPSHTGTDVLTTFSAGSPLSLPFGSPYTYSAFDITNNYNYLSGLGVQQSGNYLFASHASLNLVRVYNKITGALIQTISGISNAGALAVYNNTLWLASGTSTVAKYTINGDGTISSATLTLPGLTDPLSVAVSPDGSKVAVADRGTYHKVYIYNTSTGGLIQTIGRSETYSNPTVYTDKFYFNNTRIFREDDFGFAHAFVAYQNDGTLWVGDYGNMRCQHFDANANYIDNIQYLGYSYSSQTDINNPTRVFSDYLEFAVDYTTNAWTFVRNWSKNNLNTSMYDGDRMRDVVTLFNNRTYALTYPTNAQNAKELIELDPATGIRHTGIYMDTYNCSINKDGSQWQNGDNSLGQPAYWKRRPLTGFDVNNNPIWGTYVTVETSPNVGAIDPVAKDGYMLREQYTSSGVMATFAQDNGILGRGLGYHLGGIKNGQWLWKTSHATNFDYRGDFPSNGDFDIGNGVIYPATFMQVVDRNIFWGYKGENWKQGQANMYNHYLDNGLLVGQFGTTGNISAFQGESPPGVAGNANSGTYVKVSNDIHFLHSDESKHGAVHHWKIGNLSSIQEQSVQITKTNSTTIVDAGIDLMAGLPTSGTIASGTGRWRYSPATYTSGTYDLWAVQTGISTYKRNDRSIRFISYSNSSGLSYEGYCNLQTTIGQTNNLTNWTIEGKLMYPQINDAEQNYLDVLDNTGKVIVRISMAEVFPNSSVKANNTVITSGETGTIMRLQYQSSQLLRIKRVGSTILVAYGSNPEVTVNPLEAGANLSTPTTLRVHFYSADFKGHQIDLANLKIYSTPTVLTSNGTGLMGNYFNNKDLSEPSTVVRTDSMVNFNWGLASPLPGRIKADNFSVRWSGQVQAPVSGTYTFSTSSDDGVRLWINGAQVINNWAYHATIDNTVPIVLKAGQKYDIKLEYYDRGQAASIQLMWAYPGQGRQAVPKQWLYASLSKSSNGRVGIDAEEVVKDSKNTDTLNRIKAYPVPAHDYLWIDYCAEEAGDVSIRLVNVNTQPVFQLVHLVTQGENTLKIPVKGFAPGIYLLNLVQGYRRVSQRVILSD